MAHRLSGGRRADRHGGAERVRPASAEISRSLPRPQRRVEKRHEGRERAKGAQECRVKAWAAGEVGRKLAPGEKLLVPQVLGSRMIRAITARPAGQAGAVECTGAHSEVGGSSMTGTSVGIYSLRTGLTDCRGPLEALFVSLGGVMDPLEELLATDHRQTLEFFIGGLRDVSEPAVDREELFYNASVLAHYAQASTQAGVEWPAPANLSEVFDHFVADTTLRHDSLMMEVAGTQCLLLTGFFEDQMRPRHNIRWYAELGSGFFGQAAVHERSSHKARVLDAIARRFEPWRQRHGRLSRALRDQAYLLTVYGARKRPR